LRYLLIYARLSRPLALEQVLFLFLAQTRARKRKSRAEEIFAGL